MSDDELFREEEEEIRRAIDAADSNFFEQATVPNMEAEESFRSIATSNDWGADLDALQCSGRMCRAEMRFPGVIEYEDFFVTLSKASRGLEAEIQQPGTVARVVFYQTLADPNDSADGL